MEVDLSPLLQQVPDHLLAAIPHSRCERRVFPFIGIQQPPVLLHEAPHLLQVALPCRLHDGLHVLFIGLRHVHEAL
jgi:hypothetical protein